MISNSTYISKVISNSLRELGEYDRKILSNPKLNKHITSTCSNREKALMDLIIILLTHYPLYKGQISSLKWNMKRVRDNLDDIRNTSDNEVFNENGFVRLTDIVDYEPFTRDDYAKFESYEKLFFEGDEDKPNYYISGNRVYQEDDIDIINKEEYEWQKQYERLINEISTDAEEIEEDIETDEEKVMELIAEKLKDGNKINPNMLYQFIRNGFAHHNWSINNDGTLYISHVNEKTGKTDLNMNLNIENLYLIVEEYLHLIISSEDIATTTFLEDLILKDHDELVDTYSESQILELFRKEVKKINKEKEFEEKYNEYKKTNHYGQEEFYKKYQKTCLRYVLEHGVINDTTRQILERTLNDDPEIYEEEPDLKPERFCFSEFINDIENPDFAIENYEELVANIVIDHPEVNPRTCKFYDYLDMIEFFQDFISFHKNDVLLKKKIIYNLAYALDDANKNLGLPETNDMIYISEIQKHIDGDKSKIDLLIKKLLHALYVQKDYSNLNTDCMSFETLRLNEEYKSKVDQEYDSKKSEVDNYLDSLLASYYEKHANFKQGAELGYQKQVRLLQKIKEKIESYSDEVFKKYKELEKVSRKYNKIISGRNVDEIIDHIRNSLAHGNLDIVKLDEFNIMKSKISVRDFDKGELTFSGVFTLSDLVYNALNPKLLESKEENKNEIIIIR